MNWVDAGGCSRERGVIIFGRRNSVAGRSRAGLVDGRGEEGLHHEIGRFGSFGCAGLLLASAVPTPSLRSVLHAFARDEVGVCHTFSRVIR